MKKIIVSIMVIVALFTMTGCNVLNVHERTTTTSYSGGSTIEVREYVDGELVNSYTRGIESSDDMTLIQAYQSR